MSNGTVSNDAIASNAKRLLWAGFLALVNQQAAANPQLPMPSLRAEIERQRDLALQRRALRWATWSDNSALILFLACLFYIFFWPATRDYISGYRSGPPVQYVY
jgi:hypothetical protein